MADRGDYDRRERDDEEDEEQDALEEQDYKTPKDALMFAIDASASMMKKPPPSNDKKANTDSPLIMALKSVYQIMQQRIITNPKDMMGILLFNTEKSKFIDERSNLAYPHCYAYIPLDVPGAEQVKKLRALVEDDDDPEDVFTPSEEKVRFNDFFFCANQIFQTQSPNFGSRRLFIITNEDDPHPGDKGALEISTNRAKDLYDLGVEIRVFPVIRDDDTKFDFAKWYIPVIWVASQDEDTGRAEGDDAARSGDLDTLMSKIISKQTAKRAYFSDMPLELGPGLVISVKGYNVISKQEPARSCYVWLDGEKPQIATGETSRFAEDSARTVETGELKKAYKFGGEYVYFSPEEQKDIKKFGGKIIRIIGFKDRSLLKSWMAIKKSIFIFPSEQKYVGSTRVFSALWQKLLKSKKFGIAWYIARTNATPQLVAMIPSKGQVDEQSGNHYLPQGIWLYPLPFADDVRPGPEPNLVRTTDQLTDKMNTIVRQIQLPKGTYNPEKYPNPSLQWHYKILQTLALDEEVPDKPHDSTIPKFRQIHKRCGGYIEEWSVVAEEALAHHSDVKAIKREAEANNADEEEARPPKRAKASASSRKANADGGSAISNVALKEKIQNGELSKMKVADLKDIMVARGLDTKGLKATLIDRIEQWVDDNV